VFHLPAEFFSRRDKKVITMENDGQGQAHEAA